MARKPQRSDIRQSAAVQRQERARIERLALDGVVATPNQLRSNWPRPLWDLNDEWEFLRVQSRDRFWPFLLHAWGTIYGPHAEDWLSKRAPIAELMANWWDFQIREWLESRARKEDKQRRVMVIVAREFGKTVVGSQVLPLWLQLQDPNLSVYLGGENKEAAIANLKTIMPVLEGKDKYAKFTQMYGPWYNPELTWTREALVHAARTTTTRREPSIGIWGVESGLTGKHPDALILDDPNNYEREKTDAGWITEVVPRHCAGLQPVLQADGLLAYIGTPYADQDHLRAALKRDGIATLTGVPMADFEERPDGKWHVLHLPGRDMEGNPIVPRVWSDDRMKAYEEENSAHYWAQIMLRPELSTDVPLSREQVEDCLVNESDVPLNMLRYTMHLDTAWKDMHSARKGDESVIQIWGHFRDGSGEVVFVEGHSSRTWRGDDFYAEIVRLLQKYRRLGRKIVQVTDEMSPGKSGANRMMLESKCHGAGIAAPPMVEISRAGKNKHSARIRPACTYWQDGLVKLIRGAPGVSHLIEQMSRITPEMAFDDWADAAADVFHPDVYRPMAKVGGSKTPDERGWANPTDEILKERQPILYYAPRDPYYDPI